MGQVVDMEEARKRLRPEEDMSDLVFFDEFTFVDPALGDAIERLLVEMMKGLPDK